MEQERSAAQAKNNAKDRFILRFHDDGQRSKHKARAASGKRTLNAELLFLIEKGEEVVYGPKDATQ